MPTEHNLNSSHEGIVSFDSIKHNFTILTQKVGVFLSVWNVQDTTETETPTTTSSDKFEKNRKASSISADSLMDQVRYEAELMTKDVIFSFGEEDVRKPPNERCATLRRTVKDMSDRHNLVFKGTLNKLNIDEENCLNTFVVVADEIFDEGHINWGRVVAVFAFAAHLAKHLANNNGNQPENSTAKTSSSSPVFLKEKIAQFVGKYVANRLGPWIESQGGWDAFVEYFPDQAEFEANIWKVGLLAALGLGALATVVSGR